MNKYELTTNTTTSLTNKALTKEVNVMAEALATGNKSAWEFAEAYANIVNRDLWKDDFKTLTNLCEYVGISKGRGTQFVKALAFMKKHKFVETNKDGSVKCETFKCSVDVAYNLQGIEDFNEFTEWFLANHDGEKITEYSVRGVKELIKDYEDWKNPKPEEPEEPETEEPETEEPETASEENNGIATKEDAIKAIHTLMETWKITLEEIAK